MKKFSITKREVVFFFLGVIAVILLDAIINWEESKKSFLDGFNSTQTEVKK